MTLKTFFCNLNIALKHFRSNFLMLGLLIQLKKQSLIKLLLFSSLDAAFKVEQRNLNRIYHPKQSRIAAEIRIVLKRLES